MTQGAAGPTWVFSYNDRNEMTVAAYSSTPGGTVSQMVTYVYDAYGNRIEQDYWNGTTTVVTRFGMDGWDPAQPTPVGNENFNTWADLNSSNALTTRREFGTGFDQPIAQQSSSGTVLWYLTDYEGSVRQIVNNSGTVVGTLAYTAFGQITTNSGTTDRYGYTGMQWDTAVNLYVDGAREYNPATGRYQQQDPKGFGAGDPDLYRYVKNAPTDATDPSGNQPQNDPLWRSNLEKLYQRSNRYYNLLESIGKMKSFEVRGEKLYDTNQEYADLVNAYRELVEEFWGIKGLIEEKAGAGDQRNRFSEFREYVINNLDSLPDPKPNPMAEIGGPADILLKQIWDLQRQASKGFSDGINDGVASTVESIYNIDKLPGALRQIATNPEARQALIEQLGKKLDAIERGEAHALGELVVELPGIATGVGAGATAVKTGAKLVLKVSAGALQKISKAALKNLSGKDLVKLLVKSEWEAKQAAAKVKAGLNAPKTPPSPYQVHIDPKTGRGPMAIDTSKFASGEATLKGGIRNPKAFWKQWAETYGDTLSPANKAAIKAGRSPVVDEQWIKTFPEHAPYKGETIIHHHLDYGPNAIPLPETVHSKQPGWGIWHPEHAGGK